MDPGDKAALFIGAGVLMAAGGWGLFHWLTSIRDDSTTGEGHEAEDPAEQEGPPTHSND